MGNIVSVGDSLAITAFSMVVVFVVLTIISILIMGLKVIGGEKKIETIKESAESKEPIFEKDIVNDEELVAVLAAAIAASLGVNIPEINIKSIRRMPQTTTAWSVASRQEIISNKL